MKLTTRSIRRAALAGIVIIVAIVAIRARRSPAADVAPAPSAVVAPAVSDTPARPLDRDFQAAMARDAERTNRAAQRSP